MAPLTYFTGSLQSKKKGDLQEIALALRISDQGTKDDLYNRIKTHLAKHQSSLEDNPIFAGLFSRSRGGKRSSVPPPSNAVTLGERTRKSVVSRRVLALEPVTESTPTKARERDMRDVSLFLKNPNGPSDEEDEEEEEEQEEEHVELTRSPRRKGPTTPSSLPPLPPSPLDTSIISYLPKPRLSVGQFKRNAGQVNTNVVNNGKEALIGLRGFLSNSRNIWSLTALLELLFILYTVIPWQTYHVKLSSSILSLRYPPAEIAQDRVFWSILGHWFLPTLLLPSIFGTIISFHPTVTDDAPFDPLTASIVRLAAHVVYPYDSTAGGDVLGVKWRLLTASVGVLFAFAEVIAKAPLAGLLAGESKKLIALAPEAGIVEE